LPINIICDQHYKLKYLITKTKALFISAYDSFESNVPQLLAEENISLISIDDTINTGFELRKSIIFQIFAFIKENETSLISIWNR